MPSAQHGPCELHCPSHVEEESGEREEGREGGERGERRGLRRLLVCGGERTERREETLSLAYIWDYSNWSAWAPGLFTEVGLLRGPSLKMTTIFRG